MTENKLTVALCGNPNSGKTTLFNVLTGSNQKVGNWPGVTVEQKTGIYKDNHNVSIVDTPGIYSLSPFTMDEQVAHRYLMQDKPDLVINIIDSTSIERSLFLTSQLAELDVPMVVALNMQDEAEAKGIVINKSKLEQAFGCKFFSISASKNQGIAELMEYCCGNVTCNKQHFVYSSEIETALTKIQPMTANFNNKRWTTLKLLERDKTMTEMRSLTQEQYAELKVINKQLQETLGDIVSAVIVQQRYKQIEKIIANAVTVHTVEDKQEKAQRITEKIDKIVLNKWLAFPIFVLIMCLVFYVSIGSVGGMLTDLITGDFVITSNGQTTTIGLTPLIQQQVTTWLEQALGQNHWLTSLVVDGIIGGVMSVVGFVPQIMLLFGFIAVLEASGYMSRIAFITDRLLNKIGLGGRSFVSMIIGCGCSVPAIMATRTIKNINERNATITLTPFMPCSAKLAIISFLTSTVFKDNGTAALVAISFYFISILAVILGGLILKVFNRKKTDASDTFIMELPTYRAPTIGNVFKQMWERGKSFLIKAGTIIFTASVVLWLLQSFNFRLEFVETNQSMLASIGKIIAPLFVPLGFGDWRFSVATLTGIVAKETVVTTVEILLGGANIATTLSGLGAYSFVVYNLLTVPCMATISASFSEQGSWKNGLKSMLFQLVTAYVVSLAIFQIGTLVQMYTNAFVTGIILVAIAFAMYFSVRYLVKHKGCNYECDHCPNNESCTKTNRK